ncbi:MAG: M20/M25/M40 family metallo-hydrolase [Rhodospirillales bacterium]|nr:M20/M25/M40 family metallo-hydrolase [Rhodospirillales bacterium]MBT4040293.1 M20/M25/M40 family metallo-hydrolase [Rhodospirillales bacterium]MBT4626831.1 M20/M25/M40 family metallo-hydrolase [Rhodospirillales bacterium]MBT5350503.1 M20/M25/M40 family metallo-hydrolase [Rhodospirillales bacterium]MBT5520926.1 M20/M25/M40 family metallo-hydrolase [Rhodospirillales bacterium]
MSEREQLLKWLDAEQDDMLAFYQDLVRIRTPNPPGNTVDAAAHITDFLTKHGVPHRLVSPEPTMPNVIGTFEGADAGRHLVLNGHIDVFPVSDTPEDEGWTTDPWSGDIIDGKVYGRGSADMKCGTSASIWTYVLLHRLKDSLKGKLTLTCVSDEETFGPWGARWLMEHEPEVLGDCCLNGEPSSPFSIRYAEKGPLWLKFTIRTAGAHGAYTHTTGSATRIATRMIHDLEKLEDMSFDLPHNLQQAQAESIESSDRAMGEGAGHIVPKVTLNIGTIEGGLKNNMIPGSCQFEADIRLPVGATKDLIMAEVDKIASAYPEATYEETNFNPPSYCDPYGEMLEIIQNNVEQLRGFRPTPIVSLGGTDARLWRYENIPAYVYGPSPTGMGSFDENVPVEDFFHIVKTHVLSAYDYLMAKGER